MVRIRPCACNNDNFFFKYFIIYYFQFESLMYAVLSKRYLIFIIYQYLIYHHIYTI